MGVEVSMPIYILKGGQYGNLYTADRSTGKHTRISVQ